MAKQKPTRPAADDKANVNSNIDPEIRAQLDAYMADYNESAEHPASLRSTIEAAFKMFLREKGYWPPKQN